MRLPRLLLAAFLVLLPWAACAGSYEDFFVGVELDRPAIVAPLLAKGFDVNARDRNGQHALYVALREGSTQVAELLLHTPGLQPDAVNAANETLLMMAALRGQVGAMHRLITLGAAVNREGWAPLHYAASGGSLEAILVLLDHGAEMDAQAPNGNTPLMMAAGFGSLDAAVLLVRRGADITLRNKAGLTAADYARRGDRDALGSELDRLAARR